MLTNLNNVVRYTVSGATYAITYPYWTTEEIKAYVTLSDESVEELTYGTDFTVTTPNGVSGTLTKVSAWTDAEKLTIVREVELTQEIDLINGEKIDGEQLETGLDLKTAGLQQMQEQFTRTVKTSVDEAGSDLVIPNTETRKGTGDGTLLGFDGTGQAIALRDLKQFDADVANTAANATAAANSATLANKWAENPVDTPVEPGNYSAKHWASKASTSAGAASVSAYNADQSAEDSEAWAVGKRDGSDVPATDPTYHNNSKYYLDLVKQTISGALRYQGVWTTTGATDYSAISLPRLKGDMYYCQGSATTIGGVTYTQGDYIIFNQDVASGTITTTMLDKIDNTETVTPDNTCTLSNKTIAFGDNTMTDVASTNTAQTLTNKTIDADDNTLVNVVTKKNITNCITQIPQDIKLELSSGTLTLKAGSKVYVPNGVNTFSVYTVPSDVSTTRTNAGDWLVAVRTTDNVLRSDVHVYSGTTAPTSDTYAMWYDTTNNKIKVTNDSGSTWSGNWSFPVAVVTADGTKITAIKQVFNGMGYIGSTLFCVPNVKALIPNGRNADGSLRSAEAVVSKVYTLTSASTRNNGLYLTTSNLGEAGAGVNYYDATDNYVRRASDNLVTLVTPIATYTSTSGVISNFRPKTAFHAVDYNDWHRGSGLVHTVTTLATGFTGKLWWTVSNGICYLCGDSIVNSNSGGNQTVYEGNIPSPKACTPTFLIGNGTGVVLGTIVILAGRVRANMASTGTSWWYVTYPVADDWVE